jgi:dGTPase
LRYLRPTVERMQALLVDDLRESLDARRVAPGPKSTDAAPGGAPRLVELSERGQRRLDDLAQLLHVWVYKDRQVIRMDDKAARIVQAIFDIYVEKPQLMPTRFARRTAADGHARVVADYIAGMTDRFCQEEHARLFDPTMEV